MMNDKKIILVTGGTGTLGSAVVQKLVADDRFLVRVFSTKPNAGELSQVAFIKGDLSTGAGLAVALNNVYAVIHCASNPKNAQRVDVEGTANLLAAIKISGSAHLVYISISGIDKTDYAYYQLKLQVEKLIANSGIPYSILRTTQFHDFIWSLLVAIKPVGGQIDVPTGPRFQPIDVTEVAAQLVKLAEGKPQGHVPDFGGPEILPLEKLAQQYLAAQGNTLKINPVQPRTEREKMFASGINLLPENATGKITWNEYLLQKSV